MPPTYTYSYDPSTSSKDAVRFLCQDTDMTAGQVRLADEEINWSLTKQSNVFLCAADCAEKIAAYWARQQSLAVGPLHVTPQQAAQNYLALAEALRREASRNAGAVPIFYPTGQDGYGPNGPCHIFRIGMDDLPPAFPWPPWDLPPLTAYP